MGTTLNRQMPPLKQFQRSFCEHCDKHCNPQETAMQNCILTGILDLLIIHAKLQQKNR